uniref:ATPase MORC2-like n=2 Tax=Petromyzon marinus TaxID=7757 RepID=A0AAJ7U7D1_PETMA|nr:ATPase MORC2-like [Petromyzon marinus]
MVDMTFEETAGSSGRSRKGDYGLLQRAEITCNYLHSNSTTHEFLFGAMAEMVDNARDAEASRMNIFSVDGDFRGGYILCFLDNGHGMSPSDLANVMKFGKSTKRNAAHIGRYGNGLKSGTMRIGRDMIILTKQAATMSCLLLSRTFHEEEKIEEVIIPLPSWRNDNMEVILSNAQRYQTEMDIIFRYSPFKSQEILEQHFKKIHGSSGTLVMVYNLMLMDDGESELDITSDPRDILMRGVHRDLSTPPERVSFRTYLAILYLKPHMRLYLQHQKVITKRLDHDLYRPCMYKFESCRFRAQAEKETKQKSKEVKLAEEKARELESQARELERKLDFDMGQNARAQVRQAQVAASEQQCELQYLRNELQQYLGNLRRPKQLCFVLGLNVERRHHDGACIYTSGRLIRMYDHLGPQSTLGRGCGGVVAVVDVPCMVLEPTHNKQGFTDSTEVALLLRALAEHVVHYRMMLGIAGNDVSKFWARFGYLSWGNWVQVPSSEPQYRRCRAIEVPINVQCDTCLKWRSLPFCSKGLHNPFPEVWVCSMNPDPRDNRCEAMEQDPHIPLQIIKKKATRKSGGSSHTCRDSPSTSCDSTARGKKRRITTRSEKASVAIIISSSSETEQGGEESDTPSEPKRRSQQSKERNETTRREAGESRDADVVTGISDLFRNCLGFLWFPEYHISLDNIRTMSVEELNAFPLAQLLQMYQEKMFQVMEQVVVQNQRHLEEQLCCFREKVRVLRSVIGKDENPGDNTDAGTDAFFARLVTTYAQMAESRRSTNDAGGEGDTGGWGEAHAQEGPRTVLFTDHEEEGQENDAGSPLSLGLQDRPTVDMQTLQDVTMDVPVAEYKVVEVPLEEIDPLPLHD